MSRNKKLPEVTFETPYASRKDIAFTRKDYRTAGANIAEAVMNLLAVNKETSA